MIKYYQFSCYFAAPQKKWGKRLNWSLQKSFQFISLFYYHLGVDETHLCLFENQNKIDLPNHTRPHVTSLFHNLIPNHNTSERKNESRKSLVKAAQKQQNFRSGAWMNTRPNEYVILLVFKGKYTLQSLFILRWNLSWNSRIHTLHSKHEEPSRSDSLLVEFKTVQLKNKNVNYCKET